MSLLRNHTIAGLWEKSQRAPILFHFSLHSSHVNESSPLSPGFEILTSHLYSELYLQRPVSAMEHAGAALGSQKELFWKASMDKDGGLRYGKN